MKNISSAFIVNREVVFETNGNKIIEVLYIIEEENRMADKVLRSLFCRVSVYYGYRERGLVTPETLTDIK